MVSLSGGPMARLLILVSMMMLGCSAEISYRKADSTTAAHLAESLEVPQCDSQLLKEKKNILSAAAGLVSEMVADLTREPQGDYFQHLSASLQSTRQSCAAFFEKWGDRPCQTMDEAGTFHIEEMDDLKTSCSNLGGIESL